MERFNKPLVIRTLSVALFFLPCTLSAQSLDRFVLGTVGGEASSAAYQLEFTGGETAAGTLETGVFVLHQGFNQTNPPFNTGLDPALAWNYTLFPNPTKDRILFTLDLPPGEAARLRWHDQAGREVSVPGSVSMEGGRLEARFELGALPAGVYLLQVAMPGKAEAGLRVVRE